jgi:hypothetical protein
MHGGHKVMLISHFPLLGTHLPSSKHEQHTRKCNLPQGNLALVFITHKHSQHSHNDHLIQS